MKSASTVRGFGWVVALGGLVACVVLIGHRPAKRPAPPVAGASHALLPIDVGPDAQTAAAIIPPASLANPSADPAAVPQRRRGIFVNNTPRRRELGWAGLLESPYDTPNSSQQQDDAMAEDPDDVEADARAALNFVGVDSEAETVWAAAINNADLTADTRQQLIEALDTSGLPELQRLTSEHLPLILSRIAIVEQLAPSALDEANAAAFDAVLGRLANLAAALERVSAAAGTPESAPESQPERAPDAAPQPAPAPTPEPTPVRPQPGVDPQEP